MYARQALLATMLLAGLSGAAYAQNTTPSTPSTGTPSTGAPSTASPAGGMAKPAMPTMPAMPGKPAASAAAGAMTGSAMKFANEAEAKAHCPSDSVVWANLNSKAYHVSGDKLFGKTHKGTYMCMADATAAGFHKAGTHHGHGHASTTKHS